MTQTSSSRIRRAIGSLRRVYSELDYASRRMIEIQADTRTR
jgi:hypothetical protein